MSVSAPIRSGRDKSQQSASTPRVVKARDARNPILAERTPRSHYQKHKWKYDVPPGEQPKSRWNEPEKEDSIVAMFGSVKAKVAREKELERAYEERIRNFEETRNMASCRPNDSARVHNSTARMSTTRLETGRNETGRFDMVSGRDHTERMQTEREVALTSMPVAAMMHSSMQLEHPEILAKMRAERAAKFVETLKNPLQPPDKASMSSRGQFRPGGSLKHSEAVLERTSNKTIKPMPRATVVVSARDVDTARMKESLHSLVSALEDTDQEIARQNLKIALSKKVKTYDKKSKK